VLSWCCCWFFASTSSLYFDDKRKNVTYNEAISLFIQLTTRRFYYRNISILFAGHNKRVMSSCERSYHQYLIAEASTREISCENARLAFCQFKSNMKYLFNNDLIILGVDNHDNFKSYKLVNREARCKPQDSMKCRMMRAIIEAYICCLLVWINIVTQSQHCHPGSSSQLPSYAAWTYDVDNKTEQGILVFRRLCCGNMIQRKWWPVAHITR
jgi:hypothetical protein